MIFFLVPETKQRTLEELDYIFAVPLSKFIRYQVGTWLPWFVKRYVLFDRSAVLPELYEFDDGIRKDLKDVRRPSVVNKDGIKV